MKRARRAIGILVTVALALCFAACNGSQPATTTTAATEAATEATTAATPETNDVVIGLALPTLREASWQFCYDTMIEYAATLDGVTLLPQAADADQAQQNRQVEDLLTRGIDALIIGPVDGAAAAVIADQCSAEGVPVICYDRIIMNTPNVDYYVAINPVRVGEMQGEYIAQHAKNGAIMVFGGAPDDSNSIYYFDGAMSKIQPRIDSGELKIIGGDTFEQVVTENWLPEKAQARAENIIAANPSETITGVVSPNDGIAGGVIQALKANGIADYVISGQDAEEAAIQRIKSGEQSMTVFVSAVQDLHTYFDVAVKAARGEHIDTNGVLNNDAIDVPAVLVDPIVMTIENWRSVLEENGQYDPAIYGD